VAPLESETDIQYDPVRNRPVWHTDSTFRARPPIGTVFHCRQAPPSGGQTVFADMVAGLAALPSGTVAKLRELEAVCSLAHHDRKISLYSPDHPVLTSAQRRDNPAQRVPVRIFRPKFRRLHTRGCH
jgi:alpha-ketoglutarate-dependent taurine dioxygenase